jgi:hypothetical protein
MRSSTTWNARLDGRPVAAQADTMAYRASQFVRRHKLAVAASALLVLALTAGTVGHHLRHVARPSRRSRGPHRSRHGGTLFRFSRQHVRSLDAGRFQGQAGDGRDILERGAAKVRKELVNEPALQARLLATIGWVYARQGLYAEARPLLDEAVTLARATGETGDSTWRERWFVAVRTSASRMNRRGRVGRPGGAGHSRIGLWAEGCARRSRGDRTGSAVADQRSRAGVAPLPAQLRLVDGHEG